MALNLLSVTLSMFWKPGMLFGQVLWTPRERRREMNQDIEKDDLIEGALNRIDLNRSFSRRDFLRWSGVTVVGMTALWTLRAKAAEAPLIIMDQAEGIVIADPTKCVGCRRCELACTEFNDGKASPTTSRIKVDRKSVV